MSGYKAIIISGRPVSGKSSLAKALSQKLGWRIFSPGSLWREEWRRRYPNSEIPFEEYWRNTTVDQNREMDRRMHEAVMRGKVIGDIRYAMAFHDDRNVLKVFLDVGMEARVRRAQKKPEYSTMNEKEIERLLLKREGDEAMMGKRLYGDDYDYADTGNYDLVIKADNLSIDEELSLVEKGLA